MTSKIDTLQVQELDVRELLRADDPAAWPDELRLESDGIYVEPAPHGLTADERNLFANPSGNTETAALPLPASLGALSDFLDGRGLSHLIRPFDLADWAVAKSLEVSTARGELTSGPWPWGAHETERLRHLADAGKQFWSTYDESDQNTAPKNDDVEKYLMDKGANPTTARSIATILRPADLPTGPRKK